ncbi:MAG TPA: ABC transporter permease [Coriobacteriia bacterium]|nr:ABC transporter permease [Coriobacteriia bacterium]
MRADKPIAFVKRDFAIERSYRLAFLMRLAGMFLGIASFFFVSRLVGDAANPYLADYNGDYFGFVLVGIAFVSIQGVGLGSFSSAISGAQAQGTLEAMLVTPTRLSTIILSSSVWNFAWTTVTVLLYLIIGALFFGANLGNVNVPTTLVVLALTSLVFSGVGILSASVIMVLKRGDPVSWAFGSVSSFVGGTYFPVTVFPVWLQSIARIFPIYWGLHAMREAVLNGATLAEVSTDVLVLAAFAAVILPISIWAFRVGVRVAKTDGTLGAY